MVARNAYEGFDEWYKKVQDYPGVKEIISRYEKGQLTFPDFFAALRSVEIAQMGKEAVEKYEGDIVITYEHNDMTKFIFIAEGSGDNLFNEDIANGFVDYINIEIYNSKREDCIGGGLLLLEKSFREIYPDTRDCINDVIDFISDEIDSKEKTKIMNPKYDIDVDLIANYKDELATATVVIRDQDFDGIDYIRPAVMKEKLCKAMYDASFNVLETVTGYEVPDTDSQNIIEGWVDQFLDEIPDCDFKAIAKYIELYNTADCEKI